MGYGDYCWGYICTTIGIHSPIPYLPIVFIVVPFIARDLAVGRGSGHDENPQKRLQY